MGASAAGTQSLTRRLLGRRSSRPCGICARARRVINAIRREDFDCSYEAILALRGGIRGANVLNIQ